MLLDFIGLVRPAVLHTIDLINRGRAIEFSKSAGGGFNQFDPCTPGVGEEDRRPTGLGHGLKRRVELDSIV